jgi:hypothetical protein
VNSVSWFIYIAQVSNSLGIMFCILGGTGLVISGLYALIASAVATADEDELVLKAPSVRYVVASIAMLVAGNVMPERNTMYAIAASQVGEKLVASEAVRGVADDATKALHQWIKRQIEPDKKS